ncbi:hypothetical protein BD289DRAFT_39850 [Coniella lustricola]|uniref:Myb-like domain-containing protein n=1 Tax=Coniella lustricola TaxID=2025994 RepID=A0A2T3AIW7_9PEZI|nr:hypothetical protein BD289DRAFT_39850 [Coniella lustricola]
MLLPSAFSCDTSQPRLLSAPFIISPPTSPQGFSTQSAIGNLLNSCRNLHNLLSSPTSHLPSPPLAHMPSPVSRLRRREAKPAGASLNHAEGPRYRIKKRAPPPRGINKRRRAVEDDLGRSDDEEVDGATADRQDTMNGASAYNMFGQSEQDMESGIFVFQGAQPGEPKSPAAGPSTPKRQRIAPPDVPRGLTREDFHKIGASPLRRTAMIKSNDIPKATHNDQWSHEDDSKLVEVVLEKVKNMDLSKEVWEDCIRNLPGKDYDSVSSRWKNLIRNERIGVRSRTRSGKMHGTW